MNRPLLILLVLFYNLSYSSNIDTLNILSKSMNINIKNIVISPNENSYNQKYPVIYLLHGYSGDYTDWSSKVKSLERFCDSNNVIIVCPDGGYNSWYFDSPIDSSFKYETYIANELIVYVDSVYPTIQNSNSRAITGLSMGGHGSLYLAIKHPHVFGACGSMSGAIDIRPFSKKWDIASKLGSIEDFPLNWNNNTVINMIRLIKLTNLKIIFDCGKDDFFFEVNNIFHQELLKNNIEHIYNINEGKHNWKYWNISIFDHLNFFNNFFKN